VRALASLDLEVAGRHCSRALPAHGGGDQLQVVVRPAAMELCSGPVGGRVACAMSAQLFGGIAVAWQYFDRAGGGRKEEAAGRWELFSAVRVAGDQDTSATMKRCCGGGGVSNMDGFAAQFPEFVRCVTIPDESFVRCCWAGDGGTCECHSPSWGRCRGASTSPPFNWSWLLSLGESLDPELDRHGGGVLDVVPLLGAPCLKTRLEGPGLHSSDVRRCPRVRGKGAMHVMAGEFKMMPS
jgi:hypothetical protein